MLDTLPSKSSSKAPEDYSIFFYFPAFLLITTCPKRSLLGRDRNIEIRHGHSPQAFGPASNEAVNTCQ
jgi:hypothetical protein